MDKIDRQAALDAIPTNWCDELLTGPKAVLPQFRGYNPKDF